MKRDGIQLPLDIRLREDATFANYVGESAHQLREATGIVYVWGEPGTGRSHLLQASCHEARARGASCIYLAELDHHGPEVLERFPQVGALKQQKESEVEMPAVLSWLLARYPMLRRHPHPMTVHFPIVFMFSATVFNVLYLITGVRAFELTALHSLGAGIFSPYSFTAS